MAKLNGCRMRLFRWVCVKCKQSEYACLKWHMNIFHALLFPIERITNLMIRKSSVKVNYLANYIEFYDKKISWLKLQNIMAKEQSCDK